MKKSNKFQFKIMDNNSLSFLRGGGDGIATNNSAGDKPDTWHDNDGDGTISPGDVICF